LLFGNLGEVCGAVIGALIAVGWHTAVKNWNLPSLLEMGHFLK
jgi:hypothetical protein